MAKRRNRGRVSFVGSAMGTLFVLGGVAAFLYWIWPTSSPDGTMLADDATPQMDPPLTARSPAPAVRPGTASDGKSDRSSARSSNSLELASTRPADGRDVQRARADYQAGLKALQQKDLIAARRHLSDAITHGLPRPDLLDAQRKLHELGDEMVFSPTRTANDPLVVTHVVRAGETLGKIAAKYHTSKELLAKINRIRNENYIREGQSLKVVPGPFHVVVDKSDHEMYVFKDDLCIRCFRVALGANGRTPTGKWIVANKLANPNWVDPNTGKRWAADDPENPIGEHWIGLTGIEGDAKGQPGFGIHGTIDEASLGQDVSMGCIRLGAQDVELVYMLLVPMQSTVVVRD